MAYKIKWISYDEADKLDCKELGGLGGLPRSITRREYLNNWYKPYNKYFKILAKEIRQNNYIFGGDAHQEHYSCCPILCDKNGKAICKFLFSYRAWGDFMHCLYINKKNEPMGYMTFYMDSCIPDNYDIRYPKRIESEAE